MTEALQAFCSGIRDAFKTSGIDPKLGMTVLGRMIVENAGIRLTLEEAAVLASQIQCQIAAKFSAGATKARHDTYDLRATLAAKYEAEMADRTDIADQEPSVGTSRYERLNEAQALLAESVPLSRSWLTIGDGSNALEARSLVKLGFTDVTASNINARGLQNAFERGLIPRYRVENAEELSLSDEAFDYVLCREAYHHMPRAPLALYEMLRVARNAVILVEPQDSLIDLPSVYGGKSGLGWEICGNFIYTTSRRELIKVACGLSLPYVAFKNKNDIYDVDRMHHPPGSEGYAAWEQDLEFLDGLSKSGQLSWSYLLAILFKQVPEPELMAKLVAAGWQLLPTPERTP